MDSSASEEDKRQAGREPNTGALCNGGVVPLQGSKRSSSAQGTRKKKLLTRLSIHSSIASLVSEAGEAMLCSRSVGV